MDSVIVVSMCLLGIRCRYDGKSVPWEGLKFIKDRFFILPVCPEQLGGLSTPRSPSKIEKGDGFTVLEGKSRVLTVEEKTDVTANFVKGAQEALKIVNLFRENVKAVILKEKSPSCGVKTIYNFNSDSLKAGKGVAAALFIKNGYRVLSSDELEEIEKL
ncbi:MULTISPECIES: DUF523 domain-containing protein [unclassified Desulfurobacterium]|uniref:DUF523 domain-containing protein n=1 Tax=unclassified Desulfurobacterium TaxID=2639089 RepID=UPI0004228122|nr:MULTISPECIES: DUF523 domain-containing protein [unclassified Desulfurobacterium]